MKIKGILFLLFIIPIINACGQTRELTSKELVIKDIRKKFKIINHEKDYEVVKLENEEFLASMPDGGAELRGYYKDGELRRINVFYGLSYGITNAAYHFWDNELIFVYEKEDAFYYNAETDEWRFDSLINKFEGRYYFSGEDLIEVKLNGKPLFRDVENMDHALKSRDLLTAAKGYITALAKKRG